MLRVFIAIACVLASTAAGLAQQWQADLHTLANTAPGPEQDALIARIVSAEPDWGEVMTEIQSMTFPDAAGGEWFLDSATCIDGVRRPYVVYVPSGYNPQSPTPMLVHLHGVVGRPFIDPDPTQYVGNTALMEDAEKSGWFVLFPFGQEGAVWWDEVGMTNIAGQIRMMKSRFNIDDNRVYVSGISDGASAAFLYAMIRPTDFAAFAALNGSMGVGSEDGGHSTYAPNMANSSIYVTSADRDNYYPTSQMQKTIAMAEKAGANILYRKLQGEHIGSIIDYDYSDVFDYLAQHIRNSSPDTIIWETATPEFGVCKWLAIDEITTDEPADWHVDYNVALVDSTISIGFWPNDTFPGPGLMVASLSEGDRLSRRVGLQKGDIVINGNGMPIDSMADLNTFKATLKRGAAVSLTVKRDGKEIVLSGRMPAPRNYLIFMRDKPSAMIRAAYRDNRFDIQGSRVGAFRIRIDAQMIALDKNVVVTFNGNAIYDGRVEPDIGYMLRDYLANRDRMLVYVNEISLRPVI